MVQSERVSLVLKEDGSDRRGSESTADLAKSSLLLRHKRRKKPHSSTYEMGPWQWDVMASTSLGGATSLHR